METPTSDAVIKSHQNYELLIRVDEQLKGLSRDVRDNTSSLNTRITVLDTTKMDKAEAARIIADADKVHEDHEKRMRVVETRTENLVTMIKTWGTILGVIVGILQIIQIIVALAK